MTIKAVGFDVGHTLIDTKNPLNWKSMYRPALQSIMKNYGITETDEYMNLAINVLLKYNTRENYREIEVSSDTIFKEIFGVWNTDSKNTDKAKEIFYAFFQADTVYFCDVKKTLETLYGLGIKMGFLTDVAYGMDNQFSLKDVASIMHFFDVCLTSVDVGFRKPNDTGLKIMLQKLNFEPSQMIYVGDEEKDIIAANKIGVVSVLINRTDKQILFGQRYTISCLNGIIEIIQNHY